ncbi:MAG: type II secretion system protein GspJ [Phycisphaeraceae bacterium]
MRFRGFTLLEVMIAMAMFAVIAAGLSTSLYVAFKARRTTTDGLAPARATRLALETIARDLSSATPPVGILAGAFVGTDQPGDAGDALEFFAVRAAMLDPDAAGDVQRVSYAIVSESELNVDNQVALEGDASGHSPSDTMLVRRVTSNLLSPQTIEPREQVLCRGVTAMNFRYYDGTQWVDTWDSTAQENTLPRAVEVTLTLKPNAMVESAQTAAADYQAARVVALPCAISAITATTVSISGGAGATR